MYYKFTHQNRRFNTKSNMNLRKKVLDHSFGTVFYRYKTTILRVDWLIIEYGKVQVHLKDTIDGWIVLSTDR